MNLVHTHHLISLNQFSGRSMAQAVTRRALTAEARVYSLASPCM